MCCSATTPCITEFTHPHAANPTGLGVCIGPDDKKKLCTPTALPLFSFSKPEGIDQVKSVTGTPVGGPFWDIMYPAWTFWGGGPFIGVEPNHGLGRWDKKRDGMMEAAEQWPWATKVEKAFFRGSRSVLIFAGALAG